MCVCPCACLPVCMQNSHPAQESPSTATDSIQPRTRESHTHQTNCQGLERSRRGAFHHAINEDSREMVISWSQCIHLNPSGTIVSTWIIELIYVFAESLQCQKGVDSTLIHRSKLCCFKLYYLLTM